MIQIHFETLGCKVNQIESESAARSFSDSGFLTDCKNYSAAEKLHSETILCIVNTCTVTAKAEQKARRVIRLMLDLCPNACVLVTGCYAEVAKEEIALIDKRVSVLRGQKKDFLQILAQKFSLYLKDAQNIPGDLPESVKAVNNFLHDYEEKDSIPFLLSTDTFLNHSRSSIKIQDGCNNSCAFCRIHIARGKSISLEAEEVLRRVENLENAGHAETVLTGINLSQYSGTIGGKKAGLTELLQYLLDNTKKIAFRLSSLYPQSITEDFCRLIASPRIRPHFHLSVQSGSDRILKLMARPYTKNDILNAVNALRKVKPDAFFACDIIAGFAGESEEDFNQTVDLMEECNFTFIHAFPFSPRPGTAGYTMKPKIPQYIAGKRVLILNQIALNHKNLYVESMRGKIFEAIIENRKNSVTRAVTENFLHVQITNADKMQESDRANPVRLKILGKSSNSQCDADALFL